MVATATGRDENEDALHALCVELIAQNQQYDFASDLISRVGYPMWSRAMFLVNDELNNAPVVILPFAHLNADSTQAFLFATPVNNSWYLKITTKNEVDSMLAISSTSDSYLGFKMLVFIALDDQIFNNSGQRYVDIIFGEGFNNTVEERCFVWIHTWVCHNQSQLVDNGGAGDRGTRCLYIKICAEEGGYGGGNINSWFYGGSGNFGDGNGGYGWGGGLSNPFADPFGGATSEFVSQWQSYLGTLEPDGGNQQGGNLSASEITRFETTYTLNELGLFTLGQLQTAYNNINLTNALIAFLQAHPGDPTAQDVASLLLNAVSQGVLSESQAIALLELQEALDLTVDQTGWLAINTDKITEVSTFLDTHSPDASKANTAKAVSLGYINMLMANSPEIEQMMNDIQYQAVGDPVWDFLIEQLGLLLEDVLIDIIPGGTAITLGPVAIQQFQNNDWLGGMWTAATIVIDEAGTFFPPAKVWSVGLSLAEKSAKLAKFYDVMKKVYTLGDDMAYKVYQVLRNKLDDFYAKIHWNGNSNGAQVVGIGDPLDIWDDLVASLPGGTLGGGNGNEITYVVNLGQSQFTLKFYPDPTSSNQPTISIKKGSYEFKMRF